MLRLALASAAALAGAYGLALLAGVLVQDRLIYMPDRNREDPADHGLDDTAERSLTAPDGVEVLHWWAPPDTPEAPVVIYFHGNGANLANRAPRFANFRERGWGYAALSYRGYGGSGGRPNEADNIADALALYDWVRGQGVAPERIAVFGESLGGAMAVRVAAERDVGRLLLQAPFDSVLHLSRRRAPFLLPDLILRDRYMSIDHIGRIQAPFLWVHGDADPVIPMAHGRRLFDAAPAPKRYVIVPGADHEDVFDTRLMEIVYGPFIEAAPGELE